MATSNVKRNLKPQIPANTPDPKQQPPQDDEGSELEITEEMQALIDAEVARQVKVSRRAEQDAKRATKLDEDLPTQSEAVELVKKKNRAVLSQDGYVVPSTLNRHNATK